MYEYETAPHLIIAQVQHASAARPDSLGLPVWQGGCDGCPGAFSPPAGLCAALARAVEPVQIRLAQLVCLSILLRMHRSDW